MRHVHSLPCYESPVRLASSQRSSLLLAPCSLLLAPCSLLRATRLAPVMTCFSCRCRRCLRYWIPTLEKTSPPCPQCRRVKASSPNAALVSAERAYFSYKFDGRERAFLGSSPIKIACTLNRTRARSHRHWNPEVSAPCSPH